MTALLGFLGMLPSPVKWGGLALVAAFLAYNAGSFIGYRNGQAAADARSLKATIEQLRERGLINEDVRNLSDCQLVVELGGVCDNGG